MGLKLINTLPNPSGTISAGATVTIDVPIGPRYHVLWLQLSTATNAYSSGNTPALSDLAGEIRIKLNGRVQKACTLTELNLLQGLNGEKYFCVKAQPTGSQATTTPGLCAYFGLDGNLKKITDNTALSYGATGGIIAYVPIFLCEPWRKAYDAQEGFAWPTSWSGNKNPVFSLQIELVCGSKLAAVVPRAEYDLVQGLTDSAGNPVMYISTIEKAAFAYTGSGDVTYSQLPLTGAYQAIVATLSNTAHSIDRVVLTANDRIVRDQTLYELWTQIGTREGMLQGALVYVAPVVFDIDDLPNSALSMAGVTNMLARYSLTAAAAGTLTLLYQRIVPVQFV